MSIGAGGQPMSELRLLALYPEQMNIYADRGNVLFLQHRCEWRGIGFSYSSAGPGEGFDPEAHDLFYIGGGQDRDQLMVAEDLLATQAGGAGSGRGRRHGRSGRLRRLPAARILLPARRGADRGPRHRRSAHRPRARRAADRERLDRGRSRQRAAGPGRLREPRRPHLHRIRAAGRSAGSSTVTATTAGTGSRGSCATT